MNNAAREALREIIAKYGTEICSDGRRCEGLLRDKAGAHRREISILINALDERVPLDLLAGGAIPRELILTRLARRLEDNLALTPNAAIWAVESWALALNAINEREIELRENERIKNQKQEFNPDENFPSQTKTQKEPPQPPKDNQSPVFAPPPNRSPQIDVSIGTQSAQIPVPVGKTAPQQNQAKTPITPTKPAPRRSRKLRGCFIGCFLLLILLGVLVVGVPYTIRVMRETQQQPSQPPRVP